MVKFIHKRCFWIELESKDSLYIKNESEFKNKKQFAFWKWNLYFILKGKLKLKLEKKKIKLKSRGSETNDKSFSKMQKLSMTHDYQLTINYSDYQNFSDVDLWPQNTLDGVHCSITSQPGGNSPSQSQ